MMFLFQLASGRTAKKCLLRAMIREYLSGICPLWVDKYEKNSESLSGLWLVLSKYVLK